MAYEGIANAGNILANALADRQQKKKDDDFLSYLTGELASNQQQAAPMPQAPQVSPPQPMADMGMGISDVTAAPAASGNALPGPSPMDLLDAKKQAAQQLFSSPENTLNILLEAKKRGAGPGVGGILEFIIQQQRSMAAGAEADKKRAAAAELADKREKARAANQAIHDRMMERMGEGRNKTALEVAGIHAANRGGSGGMPRIEGLSLEDLYRLQDSTENDIKTLTQPSADTYDAYDPLSMQQFREDYGTFDKQRGDYNEYLRRIRNAIKLKEQGAPSRPAAAAEPAAQPGAGAPAPRGVYNPATGKIEYK